MTACVSILTNEEATSPIWVDEYVDVATVDHLACRAAQVLEPKTIEEALSSNKADKWKAAADSEYSSLLENQTWDLVELPPDREAIPCKWIFKHGMHIHQMDVVSAFLHGRLEEEIYMMQPSGYSVKGN